MITIKDRTENVGKWSTHDVTEHEEIKRDEIEYLQMSVGVMRDQTIKLRDLHVSDTLGWNT
jgi:hypothetical protein